MDQIQYNPRSSVQHVQQPTGQVQNQMVNFRTSCQIPPLAQKIAPLVQRIHRDPNIYNQRLQAASQQRTQQTEIPQGYHYGTDYNTLHMIANPGYQGTQNFNPQMGQQLQRSLNSNADELFLRVTKMMKNQFGLKPKGQNFLCKCPYLEWYDLVALPTNYRLPEFAKCTSQDSTSTIEHVSRYLTQLGEASIEGAHRVCFFSVPIRTSFLLFFIVTN